MGARSATAGSVRMTRRELEVAALVAQGLTNRQIAERLCISERTADAHLEHIRDKLGVGTRAQITAWVVRQEAEAASTPPVEVRTQAGPRLRGRVGHRSWLAMAAVLSVVVLAATGALFVRSCLDASTQAGGPKISTIVGIGKSGYGGGGDSGDAGPPAAAQLKFPLAVATAPDGSYFIADALNGKIRRVDATGLISTVAGGAQAPFREGALGPSVAIVGRGYVAGVAAGSDGRPYFSTDLGVFRLDADGTLHRLMEAPAAPWPGSLGGLTVDPSGDVFLADRTDHVVLRLAPDGSRSIFAGNGEAGFSGDGGAATGARLEAPTALTLDARGNLYIADAGNNRVRRVDATTGTMRTMAGSHDIYGYGGDGRSAVEARLSLPSGVAVDGRGNLYIADTGNNRVRRVDAATGRITTVAGSGLAGLGGDGGPASRAGLFGPRGLALDRVGDLYIADSGNHRVRKLRLIGEVGSQ